MSALALFPDAAPTGFDAWWAAVPRKVAKGQARRAYATALKKADADTLLAGIARYAESVRHTEKRFIKHPATWLNGECWDDEDETGNGLILPRPAPTCNITGCPHPQHTQGWCRQHAEHFGVIREE